MNTKYFLRMLVSCIGILFTVTVSAQKSVMMRGDTMVVNNEAKFWLNQMLYFGSGTMPDKTYSYVYEAPNSIQKIMNNHKRKLLGAGYKGFKCKVVKFEKEVGHSKKGDNYNILVLELPDGRRYWCDVANAYDTQEIAFKEPENKTPAITQTSQPTKTDNSSKKKTTKSTKTSKTEPVSVF